MSLYCDTRETAITHYLVGKRNVMIEHLVSGDYAIKVGPILKAVFERKSLSDYAASIRDGRSANKQNLIELRRKTGCLIFYLIEGPFRPTDTTEFGGIPYKTIAASIMRLQTQHAISVVRTQNGQHTAEVLLDFQKAFTEASHFDPNLMSGLVMDYPEEAVTIEKEDGRVRIRVKVPEPITLDQLYETEKLNPDDVLKMRVEKTIEQKRVELWITLRGVGPSTAVQLARQPACFWLSDPAKCDFLMKKQKESFDALFADSWNDQQVSFLGALAGVGPKKSGELRAKFACLKSVVNSCAWIREQLM